MTARANAQLVSCVWSDNTATAVLADRESTVELIDCRVSEGAQAVVARDRAIVEIRGGEMRGQRIAGLLAADAAKLSAERVVVFGYHEDAGVIANDDAEVALRRCSAISPGEQTSAGVLHEDCELRAPTPFE